MNVSRIQSCYAVHAPRRYTRPTDRCDRPRFGDERCDIRTDGSTPTYDAYAPSNIASPIQPPWRVLSWPTQAVPVKHRAAVAVAAVKAPLGTADVSSVGRTLDLFV